MSDFLIKLSIWNKILMENYAKRKQVCAMNFYGRLKKDLIRKFNFTDVNILLSRIKLFSKTVLLALVSSFGIY